MSSSDKDEQRELLREMIEGQLERVGLERTREQAANAGIVIDDDGSIEKFDGDIDEAIDALRYEITGNEPDDSPEEMEETDRQEYYLESIRDIVDEQRELVGEDIALKQAHQAPLKIDDDGTITGFYGKGEDALAILRGFTEHQEFYLDAIQQIIDQIRALFGRKIAIGYARRSPLEVTADGSVEAYYGKGHKALLVLTEQIEQDMGKTVADNQIREALKGTNPKHWELLPTDIRPEEPAQSTDNRSLLRRILSFFGF
ncbi:MAG: hypothetical protein MUP66_03325 [Candidatus Nanohaloarchaeota archaeon QJJ-5]|nr:hypothetical protein [Candidatus Nanohaloarchaeota archaeon QJJ-5]